MCPPRTGLAGRAGTADVGPCGGRAAGAWGCTGRRTEAEPRSSVPRTLLGRPAPVCEGRRGLRGPAPADTGTCGPSPAPSPRAPRPPPAAGRPRGRPTKAQARRHGGAQARTRGGAQARKTEEERGTRDRKPGSALFRLMTARRCEAGATGRSRRRAESRDSLVQGEALGPRRCRRVERPSLPSGQEGGPRPYHRTGSEPPRSSRCPVHRPPLIRAGDPDRVRR